jgi:hypothetical protein
MVVPYIKRVIEQRYLNWLENRQWSAVNMENGYQKRCTQLLQQASE